MSVSIVLPCYNPPQGWTENIVSQYRLLATAMAEQPELIIVQDGDVAGDNERDAEMSMLANQVPNLKVISYSVNRGKGYALRKGIEQATGDITIYTDIDFPYTSDSFLSVYTRLHQNDCDIAIGVKDASYYQKVPLLRRIISKYLQFFIRIFLSIPVTDTQCGLKGFNAAGKQVFLQTTIDRYLFDLEFVRNGYKSKHKLRIAAIPVTLNPGVHFRKMNYRILLPEIVNFIKILLH